MNESGWRKYLEPMKKFFPELNLSDIDIEFFYLLTLDREGLFLKDFREKLGCSDDFAAKTLKKLIDFNLIKCPNAKYKLSFVGYEVFRIVG